MWVASFREDAVRRAERESGVRILDGHATWGVCNLPTARVRALSRLSSDLTLQHQPKEFNTMAQRLLTEALGSCDAQDRTTRGLQQTDALHPAVTRAVSILRKVDEDLSLGHLAQRCGLSATRLSRLFKLQMGLSLVQYRTHFRVQRFIGRFNRGERENMLEAALRAGFGSYPQFHRAFWQVTGYAPSEHLRRVRSGVVTPAQQRLEAHAGSCQYLP
jgi:AraC-like DNA-binding protein